MKSLRTAMFILSMLAICVVLGTHTTTAQQATSGAASTISSPSAPPATAVAPAAYPNESTLMWNMGVESRPVDPMQQADRALAESARRLQAQYQATNDPDERKNLSDELEKTITEHFEVRQKIRAQELEELQAQIRRLQELHDRRAQEKNQIISDRLRQVLRDAEGLGWGSSDSANPFGLRAQSMLFPQPVRSVEATTVRPE